MKLYKAVVKGVDAEFMIVAETIVEATERVKNACADYIDEVANAGTIFLIAKNEITGKTTLVV